MARSIRRLAGTVVLCLFAAGFGSAVTLADEGAKAFVQRVSDNAITELTNPQINDSVRVKRMRKMLNDVFDIREVSKFVLGLYARRASPAEFEEFTKLYEIYVAHNYAGLFKRYSGEKVEVRNARSRDGGETVVSGVIQQTSGPDVNFEMRVRKAGDTYKALDLRVEGISMPLTHRKQFASVIARQGNSVAGLNKALKAATDRFEAETPSQ